MFNKELSYKELKNLNRSIYLYLHCGYNFDKVLHAISKQKGLNRKVRKFINESIYSLHSGKSIYLSFKSTKKIPSYMLNILKVGEETGRLEETFKELWNYYSWKNKSKKEMINAISYPVTILILSLVISFLVIMYFIPQIYGLMQNISVESTKSINRIMELNRVLKNYGIYIAIVSAIILVFAVYLFTNNKKIKYIILNKTPLLNSIYLDSFSMNFFNSLYVTLCNGITLKEGIEINKLVQKDYIISGKLDRVTEDIENGKSLFTSLDSSELFNTEDLNLLLTGEESGQLEETFKNIAFLKEEQLKSNINMILKGIQPLMIILLGLVIFNIIYSTIIPVIDMMEKIQ
ncbi:type II secretion system F family protein [Hathewaya histolytica]|uniref:General secretion pathway protein F n=1 Tax=Hathewaya histolytica TaxID=1498 RepID=A0A4U9R9H2_HATHI|nr:type II secretion system F family protein [Hathewaya histolytica]VTQ88039.1 general secretion pathway protein F [Hathewaya histolytica]